MGEVSKKILIIDDEAELLEGLGAYLRSESEGVVTAKNGAEGVQAFANNSDIGVVVCDINMPGMKGMDVLRLIRERDKDVPFIFFTGFGSRDKMLEAARFGAFDFIEKPDIKGLAESVRSALIYSSENLGRKNEDIQHLSEYKQLLESKNKA